MQKRLFIVSNRLPVSINHTEGEITVRQSSGGLVSAVSTYLNNAGSKEFTETLWVGIPDCTEKIWQAAGDKLSKDYTFLPIFMNWKQYELYYSGFSNSIIWPLFHYFPSYVEYNSTYYANYVEVNKVFASLLLQNLQKGDVVWIHDYHLLPLAALLREKMPDISIGFFLHIPFPSYELFRVMPKLWQQEILAGILGADLIGFQTIDYCKHFLSCVEMVLKVEPEGQYISWRNRQVKADAFPISIDFSAFNDAFDNPSVTDIRNQYLQLKGNKKMIFSVDRLDYTKGVSNRLRGFEYFLRNNPEYRENVVFMLNVIPSRDSIEKYAERKNIIDQYVSSINSTLGTLIWQPIVYQYNHLSFEELVAFYTACDVALITPLRDGMNLIAKEFVASRRDKKGVLMLSEMAGAARELTHAILINPNDEIEIAEMLKTSLELNEEEQFQRMTQMQDRIEKYDINVWATDFLQQLETVKDIQLEFAVKFIDKIVRTDLLDKSARAKRRLFLLDYDGSLIPFSQNPSDANPPDNLLQLLARLIADERNDIYIISGRDRSTLGKWFGSLRLGLIAEHGAQIRSAHGDWSIASGLQKSADWKGTVVKLMDNYVPRCPDSFIEEKEHSIAWHYRKSESSTGQIRSKELYDDLIRHTMEFDISILKGHKVVEVKNRKVDKGRATDEIINSADYDFILSVGDDLTDEDMFKRIARIPHAFSIKVGPEASFAKYNLYNPDMVCSLLRLLAAQSPAPVAV